MSPKNRTHHIISPKPYNFKFTGPIYVQLLSEHKGDVTSAGRLVDLRRHKNDPRTSPEQWEDVLIGDLIYCRHLGEFRLTLVIEKPSFGELFLQYDLVFVLKCLSSLEGKNEIKKLQEVVDSLRSQLKPSSLRNQVSVS